MFTQTQSGSKQAPNVVELVVDKQSDIATLPTHYSPGSTCIVIETSEVFMLGHDKQWHSL